MKRPTVSVGIAAYNEEKNIKSLISQILGQSEKEWKLKEILIFSDGSTDRTVKEAKKTKSNRLFVFEDKKRRGKSYRINQIFKEARGDFIVLFDADIKLKNKDTINSMVKEFTKDKDLTLVGGNSRPFPPVTFFEKAVYSTFYVFEESREKIKNGNNIFGCTGSCLTLRSKFAKSIKIPEGIMNDDDYIYFSCIKNKGKFKYVDSVVVYYKLPTNIKDYIKQSFRSNPEAVAINLQRKFGSMVVQEYKRSLGFYFSSIAKTFVRFPLETAFISLLNLFVKPLSGFAAKRYRIEWFTAVSTK